MLKRLVVVGFVTAMGVGGVTTPSFATTGVSVGVCDSAVPDSCTTYGVYSPVDTGEAGVAGYTGDCTGDPWSVPTLDVKCVYVEVDYPLFQPYR